VRVLLAAFAIAAFAPPATAVADAVPACAAHVERGSLPTWARAGFTPPDQSVPHVVGRSGRILGVLFSDPLRASPSRKHANKILWVARAPVESGDLRIRAWRMRGTTRIGPIVTRVVPGGPGPSGIDLPTPGCWRMALTWPGHRDALDVRVQPRGGAHSAGSRPRSA